MLRDISQAHRFSGKLNNHEVASSILISGLETKGKELQSLENHKLN